MAFHRRAQRESFLEEMAGLGLVRVAMFALRRQKALQKVVLPPQARQRAGQRASGWWGEGGIFT